MKDSQPGFLPKTTFLAILCLFLAAASPAFAQDYSYARIVRLSLVEGDVQISRPATSGDDEQGNGAWEQAIVNMPIQQGYTLATGSGRAEIEFESGATARLADNSVLQFTELALADGGRITRMNLSQGTATFYANLSSQDVFEVSTPDLKVTLPRRASFRVDASTGLSTVEVFKGDVLADTAAGEKRVTKNRALSYRSAGNDLEVDRVGNPDQWDRWVSDREETIHAGSTAAIQYVNSPYSYGLADLYSYGGWYSIGGYGNCWRPSGVAFGWSPFSVGQWYFWPGLGWTWISYEPWGWLPYHYGSWMLSPAYGWVWVPGFHRPWQPALVNWVRIGPRTGWVALHPNDRPGATPVNLQHGVVTTAGNTTGAGKTWRYEQIQIARDVRAEVVKQPPADFVPRRVDPVKVGPGGPAGGIVTGSGNTNSTGGGNGNRNPAIVYDPKDHKWVNNPAGPTGKDSKVRDREVEMIKPPDESRRGVGGDTPPKPPTRPPVLPKKLQVSPGPGGPPPNVIPSGRPVSPPPPHVQTPPPPQQHVQTPPPPRVQTPPPPASHWESSPRPSSAPPPPPPSGGHHGN